MNKMDEDFEAVDFFSDSYGIVVDDKIESQRIVLRTYGYEPYYLDRNFRATIIG